MKFLEKIFIAIGVGATVKTIYKIGETVGEFKGAVKEMKAIHRDLHDELRHRD